MLNAWVRGLGGGDRGGLNEVLERGVWVGGWVGRGFLLDVSEGELGEAVGLEQVVAGIAAFEAVGREGGGWVGGWVGGEIVFSASSFLLFL